MLEQNLKPEKVLDHLFEGKIGETTGEKKLSLCKHLALIVIDEHSRN